MNHHQNQTSSDEDVQDQERATGSSKTAPPQDTQGSAASSTGNTVTGGPTTDRPATAETDEA